MTVTAVQPPSQSGVQPLSPLSQTNAGTGAVAPVVLNPGNPDTNANMAWNDDPHNGLKEGSVSPVTEIKKQEVPPILLDLKNSLDKGDRVKASELITDANKNAEAHGLNEKTNWQGVIFSLLGGNRSNLGKAWTYFNGGPKYDEMGTDAYGNKYAVTYNSMGRTGQVYLLDPTKENGRGKLLSPEEYNDKSIITNKDALDSLTANWKGISSFAEANAKSNSDLLIGAQRDAYAALKNANDQTQTVRQFIDLSNKTTIPQTFIGKDGKPYVKQVKVLDYINSLPPEVRKQLALYQSQQIQSGISSGRGTEVGGSANAGKQETTGNNTSVGGKAGVEGPGVGLGLSGSHGESASASNNLQSNTRAANTTQNSQNSSNQGSTDPAHQMMAILMQATGNLGNPEESRRATDSIMNLVNLHNKMQILENLTPQQFKNIPGAREVLPDDFFTTGSQNLYEHALMREANAHHTLGYANRVYVESRKNPDNIRNLDMNKVQEDYSNSVMKKAIDRTYTDILKANRGESIDNPPNGEIRIDARTHKLYRLINGQKEYL